MHIKPTDRAQKLSKKSPSAMTFGDFQWLGKRFMLSYTMKNMLSAQDLGPYMSHKTQKPPAAKLRHSKVFLF
jgi:hypothetical protein